MTSVSRFILSVGVVLAAVSSVSAQVPPYFAWTIGPGDVTHFKLCVGQACETVPGDARTFDIPSTAPSTKVYTIFSCLADVCLPAANPAGVTVTCDGAICVEGGTPPPGPPAPAPVTEFHFVSNEPPPPDPPPSTQTVQARFSKGQVFITFQESTTPNLTYSIYRSASPIGSVTGLTPIATVPTGSGFDKYTLTPASPPRFIVTDGGPPLAAGQGLYVHTSKQAGTFYYAVTSSASSTVTVGVNSLENPIAEQVWQTPGAVQIAGPEVLSTYNVYKFMAWEDQTTWKPEFGCRNHRFDVAVKAPLTPGVSYPVVLDLHGAGQSSYIEPPTWVDFDGPAIVIFPVTQAFTFGNVDPCSGRNVWPNWFGRASDEQPKIAYDITERRILRYLEIVKADPRWQIDPTRVHVRGLSMGGHGAIAVALHHPTIFASAESSIAYINNASWGNWTEFSGNPPVNQVGGVSFESYEDAKWLIDHATANVPPIVYTFRSGDNIIWPWAWPDYMAALETKKVTYAADWQDGQHWSYWIANNNGGNWNFLRFKLNEAYPAFSQAGGSDTPSWTGNLPLQPINGQRNTRLDWGSSLHSFGPGQQLVDEYNLFAVSLKSLSTDTTATVTLRNTQQFRPVPNTQLFWENKVGTLTIQSGSVLADTNGVVTIPAVQIRAGGNRVTVTCANCIQP
jgi:pimeloyl-ACP methyl ester carboxylesterase